MTPPLDNVTDYQALFRRMAETYGVVEVLRDVHGGFVDCVIRDANPAFERASGLSREQYLNRPAREVMGNSPEIDACLRTYAEVERTGTPAHFDARFPPQNRFFHVSAFPLGDHRVGVLSVDTTERVLAEQSLQERTTQLRALASELVAAEEKERTRIAAVLHDDLQQTLVAANHMLSAMLPALDGKRAETVHKVASMLLQALETSRFVSKSLRPPALYEQGIGAAIAWLAAEMKEMHGLAVDVQADPAAEWESDELRAFVYQAVRELLLNVVKHANVKAAQVRISLCDEGWIEVMVRDAGAGFVYLPGNPGGLGLFGVRERVGFLGGRMEIRSAPGEGTCVTLVLPNR